MGSLIDELRAREAAAREEAEQLRGQIAELAEQLAGVEERLSRLVIARDVVDEVLNGVITAQVSPVPGQAEVTALPGTGHSLVSGGLAVPPWQPGLEADVLPQDYRDLLEVAEDAGRPLRAAPDCRGGRAEHGPGEGGNAAGEAEAAGGAGLAGRGGRARAVRAARAQRQQGGGSSKTGMTEGSSS